MKGLYKCPRCNEKTYEKLSTHSYCVSCNYSPDLVNYRKSSADDLPIPPWATAAVKQMEKKEKIKCPVIIEAEKKTKKSVGSAA